MAQAPVTAKPEVVLAFDGATEHLTLAAVTTAPNLLGSHTVHLGRAHAARLPGELEAFLTGLRVDRSAVASIVVGIGPGSYTGIRVSTSFAKGLARALGVPLFGASSLIAVGGPGLRPGASGVALLDARRGNCYAQALRRESDLPGGVPRITPLSEPIKVAREELPALFPGLEALPEAPPEAAYFCAVALTGDLSDEAGARVVSPLYL